MEIISKTGPRPLGMQNAMPLSNLVYHSSSVIHSLDLKKKREQTKSADECKIAG